MYFKAYFNKKESIITLVSSWIPYFTKFRLFNLKKIIYRIPSFIIPPTKKDYN
jgi:hypothetical protein